jgi:hypothetical protein
LAEIGRVFLPQYPAARELRVGWQQNREISRLFLWIDMSGRWEKPVESLFASEISKHRPEERTGGNTPHTTMYIAKVLAT